MCLNPIYSQSPSHLEHGSEAWAQAKGDLAHHKPTEEEAHSSTHHNLQQQEDIATAISGISMRGREGGSFVGREAIVGRLYRVGL